MNLWELKPELGSRHKPKRIGRGPGCGHGKTSCRGHKGQKARSGGNTKPGFEGGQLPFYRRVPKRGFTRISEDYTIINVGDLDRFTDVVTPKELFETGMIKNLQKKVKILGAGNLNKALTIKADAFSKSAKSKIENAGGKAIQFLGGH
ncbi:50S ribosomal protein L15 [Candidatus Desantisbacteria bacterium CG1_02_38_46]|uniref:Large ribosomal subunit protein uL15 n=3 Tax=unclassified Candidatus Desantisiibacteriota TaxID=3106372 RepID=A0A2H9PDR7_9BACT|nr:MAG: 50S ribosomal protein L15 [Candidatus Desantisbacteria bacterium CG1_02_38_46]PIU51331.1 MAG: 50S ribosomal protein L15 [Candidatus Desantisbacteria bacterium CG07_land_8_20_14_0_80_39_15]PIZ16955.1 MAG: 50S ribosomal protein L15 [Candidatus Desantisbacteria bacterium CG_4_10_14_0_8_um_filter_39_17]